MDEGVWSGERAIIDRLRAGDYGAWRRQVERTGFCSAPVRVAGGVTAVDGTTGEVRASFDTQNQPDSTLLIACGDRRAAVCPSCSETYRRDMWHVVASGIRGREGGNATEEKPGASGGGGPRVVAVADSGVPASVVEHPRVFVTLTAPSFGPVHTAHADGGRCRPRSGARRCRHGRSLGCGLLHEASHPVLGTPICRACYDYTGAVLWNASAGALWHRTRIAVGRALARLASAALGERVSATRLGRLVRVSYVKVAEAQKRGLMHFHIVARLDGVDAEDRSRVVAPPSWATADMLGEAVAAAADHASLSLPSPDGVMRTAQWGVQRDISDVSAADGRAGDSRRLAAYLAKYATKTASEASGSGSALARRIRRLRRGWLRRTVGAHLAGMVETAWRLGGRRDLAHLKLRQWAHSLGYRGHFATKSRRYSVTMGALRAARRAWRARENERFGGRDVWHEGHDDSTLKVGTWRYVGRGYARTGDAAHVEALAREHAEMLMEYRDHIARQKQLIAELEFEVGPEIWGNARLNESGFF